MADLGIDPSSLDASDESESVSEDTEVATEEVEASEGEAVEGEEVEGKEAQDNNESTGEEEKTEAPIEEPKLTLKEFQEIEAKRQEVEAKEKAFSERVAAQEKEFQEKYLSKVKDFDEMDAFLADLADKDADLFAVIQQAFKEHSKQYSNPVIENLRNETKSLREELNSFKSKASDEVTLTKLDSEMKDVKSTLGKEAEAAGLKVDWSKVEDLWAKGIDPKKAFMAEYGEALLKARVSKTKVETAVKKVQAQPSVKTAGSMPKANAKASEPKGLSAEGWVHHFAKQLTGKSA